MLTWQTSLSFLAAALLLALAPGPDNIFVLTQSALNGRKAGLSVTLGLCTGLIGHTLAVALGVAVVFQKSALAFSLLKSAGALYLAWLAFQSFRAGTSKIQDDKPYTLSPLKLYGRGIVMNITNPKVSIFFLAFLPQFADPARGSVSLQILSLGGIFMGATFLVFSAAALLAGFIGERLSASPGAQILLNRIAGTVFLGLAAKLALTER